MMTVQHLPLHEAERTEGHLYQERSLLLRSSEGNYQQAHWPRLFQRRIFLIFIFCMLVVAAAFSTRGILNPALEPNVSSDPT